MGGRYSINLTARISDFWGCLVALAILVSLFFSGRRLRTGLEETEVEDDF